MKPCARCNGSGTEPDPVISAAEALTVLIRVSQIDADIKADLAAATTAYREAASRRIAQREALLDEILGRFDMAPAAGHDRHDEHGTCATHWMVQVPVADIQSWRERRQA